MAGTGLGASLASIAGQQQEEAMRLQKEAADNETRREQQNKQIEAQEKAGRQQLGATLGAMGGFALGAQYGSAAGPWGAVIGGAIGAVAAGLFD